MLLGSGCFWSKEFYLSQLPGVTSTHVGFAGGYAIDPTYQQVCTKKTGHAEVVRVTYDSAVLPLEKLLQYFFSLHDATVDRRERGGQYRSAIYFLGNADEELSTTRKMIDYLREQGVCVVTEAKDNVSFYSAAGRHQQYCTVRNIDPRDPRGVSGEIWTNFKAE